MFHLFNNVQLEHVQFYSSQYEHMILSADGCEHPMSRMAKVNLGTIPAFDTFLSQSFEGDVNKFWEFLLKKDKEHPFVVFVDSKLLSRLQIQYWKSVFEDASPEDIYKSYQFYVTDRSLKRSLSIEPQHTMYGASEAIERLDFEAFKYLYDSIEKSEELLIMDRSELPFEYLLANYYLAPDSSTGQAFLGKLEELTWKIFFDNTDILRGEILNTFYDIKRIFPEANIDFTSFESIKSFIDSEPKLKWVTDYKFHERNKNHVMRYYSKDAFLYITTEMLKASLFVPHASDAEKEAMIAGDDQILIINSLFDRQYQKLLEANINKNFGCLFLNDSLISSSNQLLPLYVYEKIRNQEWDELHFLKIKG